MKSFKFETKEKKENSISLLSNTTKRNAIVLASLIGTAGMAQAAECYGVINSWASDSSGTACTVSGTPNYDYIQARNGTIATVLNPVNINATSSGTAAVMAESNASINFMGNTTVQAHGKRHGVYIDTANIVVNGNLASSAVGKNTRAVHVSGTGSTLTVNGNLTGARTGDSGGAVVELTGGNSITVGGATH